MAPIVQVKSEPVRSACIQSQDGRRGPCSPKTDFPTEDLVEPQCIYWQAVFQSSSEPSFRSQDARGKTKRAWDCRDRSSTAFRYVQPRTLYSVGAKAGLIVT